MALESVNGKPEEEKLVKLYMELTGANEAAARAVFMYVCAPKAPAASQPQENPPVNQLTAAPHLLPTLVVFGFLFSIGASALARPGSESSGDTAAKEPPPGASHVQRWTNSANFVTSPLSLADAINIALQRNPAVLRAQKDLQATAGIAIQTRAIALPSLGIAGSYSAAQRTDVDIIETPGFTFGTAQNWSTQIKLVQSVYQGGRMLSALRAARLAKQQAVLNYQTVLADTVLNVQVAYDDVLLAAQQIVVQEASVELLTRELADTQRRYDAGTVPRFNVLRAEVEVANARPRLIRARNDLRIGKNNLANLLGFTVPRESFEDIPLTLSGKLEAEPYAMDLQRSLSEALARRTELSALEKARALRREDIVNAKAAYKPVLQGYFGYDAHNSILSSNLTQELHGWIGGAQVSWNLFDGLRTQGRIREARANFDRAEVDLEDAERRIELEVRTAYSNFIEAREVLESQKKVVEEADEALRLARARSEAGTGTQLDVLSAQTALTEARTTQIQALHDYATARARLQRATGGNVPNEPPK